MINSNSPIAVFDSGVGGISVLGELWKIMPNENYLYFGDSKNAPYGTKSEEEIKNQTQNNIKNLIDRGCKCVVIACNTATSVAIRDLRQTFDIPIIGIEPAVKPAVAEHKGGKILVMATPVTLKKEKFALLMDSYSDISKIIPLPCPELVEMIEQGITEGEEIRKYLNKIFEPFKNKNIDAIVLGCTHFPFAKKEIQNIFGSNTDIIDGGYGTAKETKRRLTEEGILNTLNSKGHIEFESSKDNEEEINLMKKLFEYIISQ